MEITITLLDSEAEIIAAQYGFNEQTAKVSLEEFVLEQFKQFGRNSISSKVSADFIAQQDALKDVAVKTATDSISF